MSSVKLKREEYKKNLIKNKFNQTKAYLETYPDSQYESANANSVRLTREIVNDSDWKKMFENERKSAAERVITISRSETNPNVKLSANELVLGLKNKMEVENVQPQPKKEHIHAFIIDNWDILRLSDMSKEQVCDIVCKRIGI